MAGQGPPPPKGAGREALAGAPGSQVGIKRNDQAFTSRVAKGQQHPSPRLLKTARDFLAPTRRGAP
jgi:hypothetical protein